MAAIDRLIRLQQEGKMEPEIIGVLREEGFQMTEISDAFAQTRIKDAVSQDPYSNQYSPSDQEGYSNSQETYPSPEEEYGQGQNWPSANQQNYEEGYYGTQGSQNTMTDIAEQVVSKRIEELSKIIEKVVQSTNSNERELKDIKERTKRIEDGLDSIQRAIVGKIGEFGESTRLVQKDLENIHGTMSKMMNPLIDNYNELKKLNQQKSSE